MSTHAIFHRGADVRGGGGGGGWGGCPAPVLMSSTTKTTTDFVHFISFTLHHLTITQIVLKIKSTIEFRMPRLL